MLKGCGVQLVRCRSTTGALFAIASYHNTDRTHSHTLGACCARTRQVEAVRSGIMNSRDKDHVRFTGLLAGRLVP